MNKKIKEKLLTILYWLVIILGISGIILTLYKVIS